MSIRKASIAAALFGLGGLLAGCAQDGSVTVSKPPTAEGGAPIVSKATPVQTAKGRRLPPPPASTREGRDVARRTPTLGNTRAPLAPATPPPNVRIGKPPTTDYAFSPDTRAVFDKYRLNVRGRDLTEANLAVVSKAAQLYQPRRHTLTVVVERDSTKLPVAGVWYQTSFGSATTEFYQPQMQHVADHEFAHDVTLLVNPAAGSRLGSTIVANQNDPSVFPSSYSRTKVPEAMAESLSFWAEKVARPNAGSAYNPPAAVVADLQPFLADGLKNR